MRRFPYLGHGVGNGNELRLWIGVGKGARLDEVSARVERWSAEFGLRAQRRADGSVARFSVKGVKRSRAELNRALHEQLDAALLAAHAVTPIALAVRDNRVALSDWHAETMGDAGRLLDGLDQLIAVGETYAVPGELELVGQRSSHLTFVEAARKRPLPALVELTLDQLFRHAATKENKAVIGDLLLERLPSLCDRDFDCDVMLREALAPLASTLPTTYKMSARFEEEVRARLLADHQRRNGEYAGLRARHTATERIDWTRVDDVRAAIAAKRWHALERTLDDSSPAHGETLAQLTPEERLALVEHGNFPVHLANAATRFVWARDFVKALALFDAAIEGKLPAECAANPLYAAQNDNNHLGVDAARGRRYLERCLPHGPANPGVYVNAACIHMELGEPDEAIAALQEAQAHGATIKEYRNDPLFVPLRKRADFKKLMR